VNVEGLSVGAFSRATSISVNTLRSYHEIGLLVPAAVDSRTGYRWYAAAQLADAFVVVRLRALDMPLPLVKQVLDARDPEFTRAALDRHSDTMRQRLADTARIVAELQDGLSPMAHTPVHVRDEPERHTVRVVADVSPDELWEWLGRTHSHLLDVIASMGSSPSGPVSARYEPEIASDDTEHVEACITIAEPFLLHPDRGVSIGEIPAGRFAVLVHRGGFASIGDTYRALGAWVARHARPTEEKIIEHYLDGSHGRSDGATMRTEICWPIEREAVDS
jgi:DNA-binding transcriptional MerR regulator